MIPDDLVKTVAEEAKQVRQFVELLELEQSALTHGKTDALSNIAEQKEKLAGDLNRLGQKRSNLLASLGYSPDRLGMDAWRAKHPQAKALWSNTLSLAAKARELNRVNGELIEMHLQYNNRALDILLRKETTLDLYGPDGKTAGQGDRRIDDAV